MKIDAQKITQLRQSKAWSQQHLADVSGLSLRTVQRIENTHAASKESIRALASAFAVTPQEFLITEPVAAQQPHSQPNPSFNLGIVGLALCAAGLAFYWSQSVTANSTPQSATPIQGTVVNDHQSLPAATAWLETIDAGNYADSWQSSGSAFQGQVSQQQWVDALNTVRQPLGAKINRAHGGTQTMTSLPGLPDGEYVVLSFKSQFANKDASVETLTMSNDNGTWKAIGYFIR